MKEVEMRRNVLMVVASVVAVILFAGRR